MSKKKSIAPHEISSKQSLADEEQNEYGDNKKASL